MEDLRTWQILKTGWDILPDVFQELLASRIPVEDIKSSYEPLRSLPIKYGDFEIDILVPRSRTSPWRNYDENCRPYHEPLATKTYIDEVAAGDVVWDLGSRFGYEATIFSELVGEKGRVHVFELASHRIKRLHRLNKNQFNGELVVNHCSIGSPPNSLADPPNPLDLGKYANADNIPDFVKIDIESAELQAIKDMQRVIESNTPKLLIEWHGEMWTSSEVKKSKKILEDNYKYIYQSEEYRDDEASWEQTDSIPTRKNVQIYMTNEELGSEN